MYGKFANGNQSPPSELGRWPANLIHDGSDEVLACFPETGASPPVGSMGGGSNKHSVYGDFAGERHQNGHGDSGSAARFFYTAKADADDRLGSRHPTVKPLDLIQYLVRLVTPKGGVCLDLFAGTGTTGEACFREGFRTILIERESEYIADIERRMSLVMEGPVTRAHSGMKARGRPRDDGPLFGGSEEAPRQSRPIECIRNGSDGPFGKDRFDESTAPLDLLDIKIELAKIAVAAGCDIDVSLTNPIDGGDE